MAWNAALKVTVFGTKGAGKTTILNALVEEDLLPLKQSLATLVRRVAHFPEQMVPKQLESAEKGETVKKSLKVLNNTSTLEEQIVPKQLESAENCEKVKKSLKVLDNTSTLEELQAQFVEIQGTSCAEQELGDSDIALLAVKPEDAGSPEVENESAENCETVKKSLNVLDKTSTLEELQAQFVEIQGSSCAEQELGDSDIALLVVKPEDVGSPEVENLAMIANKTCRKNTKIFLLVNQLDRLDDEARQEALKSASSCYKNNAILFGNLQMQLQFTQSLAGISSILKEQSETEPNEEEEETVESVLAFLRCSSSVPEPQRKRQVLFDQALSKCGLLPILNDILLEGLYKVETRGIQSLNLKEDDTFTEEKRSLLQSIPGIEPFCKLVNSENELHLVVSLVLAKQGFAAAKKIQDIVNRLEKMGSHSVTDDSIKKVKEKCLDPVWERARNEWEKSLNEMLQPSAEGSFVQPSSIESVEEILRAAVSRMFKPRELCWGLPTNGNDFEGSLVRFLEIEWESFSESLLSSVYFQRGGCILLRALVLHKQVKVLKEACKVSESGGTAPSASEELRELISAEIPSLQSSFQNALQSSLRGAWNSSMKMPNDWIVKLDQLTSFTEFYGKWAIIVFILFLFLLILGKSGDRARLKSRVEKVVRDGETAIKLLNNLGGLTDGKFWATLDSESVQNFEKHFTLVQTIKDKKQ